MRLPNTTRLLLLVSTSYILTATTASPVSQAALTANHHISESLFADLEELSRIVDISYCVGTTGIRKPFSCAHRCGDFGGFELVTTWETGPLLADSCGYLAIDHSASNLRIILAFRGTYSIANTIADLSIIPQEYIPYPGDEEGEEEDNDNRSSGLTDIIQNPRKILPRAVVSPEESKCESCTVHAGFMASWRHTRPHILSHLEELVKLYPQHQLTLVGHSLGGAVAALAGLDFQARGWKPQVTTFGEPRIGNGHLMRYIDKAFNLEKADNKSAMYRRVTHADDPVPLLPLSEWGYEMHAGEIFISKPDLPPAVSDLRYCKGDADPECIAVAGVSAGFDLLELEKMGAQGLKEWFERSKDWLTVPARFRIWQLFFAHRDYFWRLGLCLPIADGWEQQEL